MSTITIGVDSAKSVFSMGEVEASGRVIRRQDLGREAFSAWLAQLPAGTVVAMEACSGAHHWARLRLDSGFRTAAACFCERAASPTLWIRDRPVAAVSLP